jgi:hypothetical protein
MKTDLVRNVVRVNLGLAFVEGLLVFLQYIQTPSESAAAVFLGFSPLRLAILVGVLLVLALTGYFFVSVLRPAWWEQRPAKRVALTLEGTSTLWFLIPALVISYFLVFSTNRYLGPIAGYRERLFPILVWFAVVVIQLLFSWLYMRSVESTFLASFRCVLVPAGIALLAIILLVLFIALTRIGLTADAVYWQEAGVPILFAQMLLVALLSGCLYLLFMRFHVPDNKKVDVIIFLALWGVAFAAWSSGLTAPSYNALQPVPPNFQSYPFGDAMRHDLAAQNFLIGKPIPADFLTKPLYSFFLALLHVMAGQNFSQIVLLQLAVFAFIPSCAYSMTKMIGGRLSGILASLLLVLREFNSLRLSNIIQVSHVQLLLSDVLAMGGMILLAWLMLQWLSKSPSNPALPVASGGVLGLLILLRGHPVLLAPVLFLMAYIYLWKRGPMLHAGLWRIAIGLLVVMIPWFWHTYNITGRFAFQDSSSSFQLDAFAQSFANSNTASGSYREFQEQMMQHFLTHPLDVVQFTSAHYLHNTVFSYLLLPQSFQVESLREYVKRFPFWGHWDGKLGLESWLLLLLHASILALGFGSAWNKTKGQAFIPIILCASYNLSVAVTRRSGWRFILPADWVTLVFYAVGIAQAIVILFFLMRRFVENHAGPQLESRAPMLSIPGNVSTSLTGLPFFLIAISLVLGHKGFMGSVPVKSRNEIVQAYAQAVQENRGMDAASIERYLQQKDAIILYGKALYPMYFKPNDGALNDLWLNYAPQPYRRLVFHVIGPQPVVVILRTESRPSSVPDGADVIVLGCRTETGVEAVSVLITSTDPQIVYHREPLSTLICPLPEPR